jgi:hypothetical protein
MKRNTKIAAALVACAVTLQGCYMLPYDQNGQPFPIYPIGVPPNAVTPPTGPTGPGPVALNVRLYPENDAAVQTGVITGTVVNMMNGKGRFQLNFRGEVLTGEATRVDGDARKGVASAFSPSGAYMSCEYQMSSPRQGAGTCTMSNGAKYQAHIGS